MDPGELFRAGKLREAVAAQTEVVRARASDLAERTLLFELLCFSGEFDRAARQLEIIGKQDGALAPVALAYENLLESQSKRSKVLTEGGKPRFLLDPPDYVGRVLEAVGCLAGDHFSQGKSILDAVQAQRAAVPVRLNGEAFGNLRDTDEVFTSVFEVFIGGEYFWLPFEQIGKLTFSTPERPRDLLWRQVVIVLRQGTQHRGHSPALYDGSQEHEDELVRLGRLTDWFAVDEGPTRGMGQHTLVADEREVGILEINEVDFP